MKQAFPLQAEMMTERNLNSGLTLVELLVVLVILIGVGSVFVSTISNRITVRGADGESREMGEVVTLQTMRTVRDALIGTSSTDRGYYGDVGNFRDPDDAEEPNARDLGSLIDQDLSALEGQPATRAEDYSPATKRGWNGPYLVDSAVRYDSDFNLGSGFASTDVNGFAGFEDDDLLILDGWGSPLVLGHEDGTDEYWLVSAGPDRNLDTDLEAAVDADRNDDIILFLLTNDPNG